MAIVRNENVSNCFECRYFNYNSKKKESECMTDIKCDFTKRRTGVLDKNGVEIYEGDYVYSFKHKDIWHIYFEDESGELRFKFNKSIFGIKNISTIAYKIFEYEIIDPDNIETYTDENGIENWRVKE